MTPDDDTAKASRERRPALLIAAELARRLMEGFIRVPARALREE